MLRAVVERHLEKVALAAKSAPGFDVDQARSDDKRALWTYALLDAQGAPPPSSARWIVSA
ncbi:MULTISPECIES: hypothetical protein [Bradyrhizobium]|jgi:hypothetical protein|uniref:Uncharacterized protein n=1 Tax=Bradyrhizobium algeriense TaxID=634784 RepID=A0ABU8B5S2_9BRAD